MFYVSYIEEGWFMNSPGNLQAIKNSRIIKILLCVLIVTVFALIGIKLVDHISDASAEKEMLEGVDYSRPDIYDIPELKTGKYYLNGDTDSYYFEVYGDSTLELCCDDMYSLFEKWNPGKEDIIREDVEKWSGRKPYNIVVTELGTVILSVEWEYDSSGDFLRLSGGPCLIADNTLGKWGSEGDFILVE